MKIMELTQRKKDLIITSFAQVAPQAERMMDAFYQRLFELSSDAAALFETTDMDAQRQKILATLAVIVDGLYESDALEAKLRELGERHLDYGVEKQHYEAVGVALIGALRDALGTQFTPEVREAWVSLYQLIASEAMSV